MTAGMRKGVMGFRKRLIIVFLVFGMSASLHRLFASVHQELFGAILFIFLFSLAVVYNYSGIFRKAKLGKREYSLSMILTYLLTILMFAFIYAEPIDNSSNYFLEFGIPSNITFPDAFYFSAITMSTLGYGDISPVGVFRYIVVVEVFCGLIYGASMAYFIAKELEE